jgi:hypothetical protein
MNPEIEKLIEFALADGVITDKEREVIRKKAEKLGEDPDEAEMILDAKLVMKDNNISDDNLKNSKKTITKDKEVQEVKHNYTPKKPVFKEKPVLNKEKELLELINTNESEIKDILNKVNTSLEKLGNVDDELKQKSKEINSLLGKSKDLKQNYYSVLNQIQKEIQNRVKTNTVNSPIENLLFTADKNSIIDHYVKATWSTAALTNKRVHLNWLFIGLFLVTGIYWVVDGWFYAQNWQKVENNLMRDLYSGILSEKPYFGIPGYIFLIISVCSYWLVHYFKERADSKSLNFYEDDIKNALNKIITPEIQTQLKTYNQIKENLDLLKKELTFKTNYEQLKSEELFK